MTTQIAVRLPDAAVEYLDSLVSSGVYTSRAAAVTAAIERDLRARAAERDAAIYASSTEDDDLAGLIDFAQRHFPDLD